jgi:hypothetical protein
VGQAAVTQPLSTMMVAPRSGPPMLPEDGMSPWVKKPLMQKSLPLQSFYEFSQSETEKPGRW